MSRILCALCLVVLLPAVAKAATTSNIINTDCSGVLTTTFDSGASLACSGNLTLDGGFVTSDSSISIFADGDLSFHNLIFTAPDVSFSTLFGSIKIGNGVVVNYSGVVPKPVFDIPQKARVFILGAGGNISIGKKSGVTDQSTTVGGIVLRSDSGSVELVTGSYNPSIAPVLLSAIPEPSTYLMLLLGLGLIAIRRTSNH